MELTPKDINTIVLALHAKIENWLSFPNDEFFVQMASEANDTYKKFTGWDCPAWEKHINRQKQFYVLN